MAGRVKQLSPLVKSRAVPRSTGSNFVVSKGDSEGEDDDDDDDESPQVPSKEMLSGRFFSGDSENMQSGLDSEEIYSTYTGGKVDEKGPKEEAPAPSKDDGSESSDGGPMF